MDKHVGWFTDSHGVLWSYFSFDLFVKKKNEMCFSSPLTFVGKRSEEALSGGVGLMGNNFVQKVSKHWEETALVNTVFLKKKKKKVQVKTF